MEKGMELRAGNGVISPAEGKLITLAQIIFH